MSAQGVSAQGVSARGEALAAFREAVGAPFVRTDAAERAHVEAATFRTTQRVPAVVRPANRDEVQACLRIATRYSVPVYPVSAGCNWGYGSRVPVADGCVVLQLDRMDRILDFDDRLGCVTVEPGVTFAALQRFLDERRAALVLVSPGSTDRASLIGHALERGIVAGAHGDRAAEVCGLEVVLADGRVLHTGFAPWTGARTASAARHGLGPALDGLFFQSNLGVVTRATFFLPPRPRFFQRVSFRVHARARLGPLLDALQAMRRDDLFDTGTQLHNAYKILTLLGRRPPGIAGALRLADFPPGDRARLGRGRWFGEAAVAAADEAIGRAKRMAVRAALDPVVDAWSFDDPNTDNPLSGGGAGTSLSSAYFRHRDPPPPDPDPDRDRCGLLWCCPMAPFHSEAILECLRIVEETLVAYDFEPIVSAQCHSIRAVHIIAAIHLDRDDPAQEEAALACHDALLRRLFAAGFIPYRIAGPALPALPSMRDDNGEVRARIKGALDPAAILAPGRYELGAGRGPR